MHLRNSGALRLILTALVLFRAPQTAIAFNYLDSTSDPKSVVHAGGYIGRGGEYEIDVAIEDDGDFSPKAAAAVQNVIKRWNALQVTTSNVQMPSKNEIPADSVDFESILLHEMGHALGLNHVNLDYELGIIDNGIYFGRCTKGPNDRFDVDKGPDQLPGTADDRRGDDVNLNFFQKGVNKPFELPSVVDKTTYSTSLGQLPSSSRSVAIPSVYSSVYIGSVTTAVMFQGLGPATFVRSLTADDVAAIKYAQSGLDETAGTPDDYRIRLRYRGLMSLEQANREQIPILIAFDPESKFADGRGLARTQPYAVKLPGTTHSTVGYADIIFGTGNKWFFNPVSETPWQNGANPFDVDNDTYVSPRDMLLIINSMNAEGSRKLSGRPDGFFFDVDADGYIAPIDALLVLNYLNAASESEEQGEGEFSGSVDDRTNFSRMGTAAELDRAYELYCPSSMKSRSTDYYTKKSWNPDKNKFFYGKGERLYYITREGEFYRWGGSFPKSVLIAKLKSQHYENPALLYDAATLGRLIQVS